MKQEGTHVDFYASEATRRSATAPGPSGLTRYALAHWWRPVGSGVMPHREVRFLAEYLFAGPRAPLWPNGSTGGWTGCLARPTCAC